MGIKWEVATPRDPFHFMSSTSLDGEALVPAFQSLWRQFFRKVLPYESTKHWDHVRCNLWLPDGFVAVHVADLSTPFRRVNGAVKLLLPTVQERLEAVENSLDDDAIEEIVTREDETTAELLCHALNSIAQEVPWDLIPSPDGLRLLMIEPEVDEPFVEYYIERRA